MSFDYEKETEKLNNLRLNNWPEWNKKRLEFLELTKFRFDDILIELENYLSLKYNEPWNIQKIANHNKKDNEATIYYFATNIENIKLLYNYVDTDTPEYEKQQELINLLSKEGCLFLIGSINKKFNSKRELIDYYLLSNEKRNYMSDDFFNIPESHYDLYDVIIKYINIEATNKLIQKQKVHA